MSPYLSSYIRIYILYTLKRFLSGPSYRIWGLIYSLCLLYIQICTLIVNMTKHQSHQVKFRHIFIFSLLSIIINKVSPWWQSPDLRLRPVGTDAPALCQTQGVRPTALQTQTALFHHTGHRFLLRDPEGTIDREERGQRKVLLQQ